MSNIQTQIVQNGSAIGSIITLDLAKKNSNIDWDDDDTWLEEIRLAVEAEIEGYLGISVLQRNVTLKMTGIEQKIQLLSAPVRSIVSVIYYPTTGAAVTIPASDYELFTTDNGRFQFLFFHLDSLPELKKKKVYPVEVVAEIGFDVIPKEIQQAALLLFSKREQYREDMGKLNRNFVDTIARSLIRKYRISW